MPLGLPVCSAFSISRSRAAMRSQALAAAATHTREFAPGEEIVRQGTRPTECRVLVSGMAAPNKVLPEGNRQIMTFAVPGDFLDLDGVTLGKMDHSVSALS